MKLIMDMYLKLGPEISYPLVLHMLQQGLQDADPMMRSHSFDTVYNLSIHSQMLCAEKEEAVNGMVNDKPEVVIEVGSTSPMGSARSARSVGRRPLPAVASHSPAPSPTCRGVDPAAPSPVDYGSDCLSARETIPQSDNDPNKLVGVCLVGSNSLHAPRHGGLFMHHKNLLKYIIFTEGSVYGFSHVCGGFFYGCFDLFQEHTGFANSGWIVCHEMR